MKNRKYIDKIICKYNGEFWLNVLLSDIYGTTVKNMPDIKVFFNYEKSYENHLKSFDKKLSNKKDFYLYKSYCPEYVVIDGKRRKMYNDKNICYFNYNNKEYEFSCFDIEKFDIEQLYS